MLKQLPHLIVLVTSRQRLNQSSEMVFYLDGMQIPDSDQDISNYDAVRLFLQSARQVQPDFELDERNSASVVQLCRLVQGMPLGIMLAASWLSMLTVDEIISEIQRGIDFLASDMVDLPIRQRSIRAVFDHSWNLLSETEMTVFMRMAVFRGGFTREAVTAITGADLRMLIRLSNKCLIRRDKDTGRYTIHELLREYAEERLAISGNQVANNEKHARFHLNYLTNLQPNLKGFGQVTALKAIESDYDNIKASWQWFIETLDLAAIEAAIESLTLYYQLGSRSQEGQRVFEAARQALSMHTEADSPYWSLSIRFHHPDESAQVIHQYLDAALTQAEKRQDKHEIAYCQVKLGELSHHFDHDADTAIAHYEIGVALYRQLDEHYYLAEALRQLGEAYRLLGEVEKNERLIMESYHLQQSIGDECGLSQTLRARGMMTFMAGDYAPSRQHCIDAVQILRRMNYLAGQINNSFYVGVVTYFRGDLVEGRQTIEESLAAATDIGLKSAMAWAYATISTFDSFAGDYELAQHHLKKSEAIQTNPFQQIGAGDSWLQLTRRWAEVVLLLGCEDYANAKSVLHVIWQQAYETHSIAYFTMFMPIVAILERQAGNAVASAELLGLTFAQSELGTNWMHDWVQLNALRDALSEELGEDAYQAAWQHGTQFDLITTGEMILESFWTDHKSS